MNEVGRMITNACEVDFLGCFWPKCLFETGDECWCGFWITLGTLVSVFWKLVKGKLQIYLVNGNFSFYFDFDDLTRFVANVWGGLCHNGCKWNGLYHVDWAFAFELGLWIGCLNLDVREKLNGMSCLYHQPKLFKTCSLSIYVMEWTKRWIKWWRRLRVSTAAPLQARLWRNRSLKKNRHPFLKEMFCLLLIFTLILAQKTL